MSNSWLVAIFPVGGITMAMLINWFSDALPQSRWHTKISLWQSQAGALAVERHLLTTIICLAASIIIPLRFGVSLHSLVLLLWGGFFLLIAVIDFEHRLVLNKVLLVGIAIALCATILRIPLAPSFKHSLLGAGVGFALFALIALLGRGAMGAGDVKLAGTIGLVIGYPNVLAALLAGVIIGGIAALYVMLKYRDRRATIPYAPWLAAGAMLVLLQNAAQLPT